MCIWVLRWYLVIAALKGLFCEFGLEMLVREMAGRHKCVLGVVLDLVSWSSMVAVQYWLGWTQICNPGVWLDAESEA